MAADAAARFFSDWIAARGGTGQAEFRMGHAQVRRYIEQYGDARFTPLDRNGHAKAGPIIPNRAGFRRGDGESREWLVTPEVWKSEVASGFDPGTLARGLVARGMMRVGGDGKPQVKTSLPGLGKVRVYIATAKIFEEAENV
jgi:uncharacterized protein (DUF927 family)